MVKKWFPRGVLVSIICGLAYLMSQTWGWELATPKGAEPTSGNLWVLLFFIESGVMIAALSLLVETFLSKDFQFDGSSRWLGLFYGSSLIEEWDAEGRLKGDVVSVHICTLMMIRSVAIVMFGGFLIAVVYMIGALAYEFINYLMNPYVPDVKSTLPFVFVFIAVISLFAWLNPRMDLFFSKINNISTNKFYRVIVWWVFISLALSLALILAMILTELTGGSTLWSDSQLYIAILQVVGGSFAITGIFGLMMGVVSGIYLLAKEVILRLSMRYPWLNELWNTVCPIVQVRVKSTRKTA